MSTELFLDFLGIRMDSRKVEGVAFTINLITPDNGEKFIIELSNATLTNLEGFLADDPDLTITINRTDLEQVMMGAKPWWCSTHSSRLCRAPGGQPRRKT
jgi:alkyl sulfatase BDS1-like metallo-beta-lactamase superfamily hydrolase